MFYCAFLTAGWIGLWCFEVRFTFLCYQLSIKLACAGIYEVMGVCASSAGFMKHKILCLNLFCFV